MMQVTNEDYGLFFCVEAMCALLCYLMGANNASNSLGPAQATRALSMEKALLLGFVFEVIGGLLESPLVYDTLDNIADFNEQNLKLFMTTATAAVLSTFLFLALALVFHKVVSVTHTVVGAMIGAALGEKTFAHHTNITLHWSPTIILILFSWITSPIITFFISTFTFKFIKSRRILSGHKPYIRAMIYSPIFVGTICFCCGLDIGLCKFLTYLGGLHWKIIFASFFAIGGFFIGLIGSRFHIFYTKFLPIRKDRRKSETGKNLLQNVTYQQTQFKFALINALKFWDTKLFWESGERMNYLWQAYYYFQSKKGKTVFLNLREKQSFAGGSFRRGDTLQRTPIHKLSSISAIPSPAEVPENIRERKLVKSTTVGEVIDRDTKDGSMNSVNYSGSGKDEGDTKEEEFKEEFNLVEVDPNIIQLAEPPTNIPVEEKSPEEISPITSPKEEEISFFRTAVDVPRPTELELFSIRQARRDRIKVLAGEEEFMNLVKYAGFAMCLSHGSNDLANILVLVRPFHDKLALPKYEFQIAYILAAFFMGAGVLFASKLILRYYPSKIMTLTYSSGFSVVLGVLLSTTVFTALGMPISTTASFIGGLLGVRWRNERLIHQGKGHSLRHTLILAMINLPFSIILSFCLAGASYPLVNDAMHPYISQFIYFPPSTK